MSLYNINEVTFPMKPITCNLGSQFIQFIANRQKLDSDPIKESQQLLYILYDETVPVLEKLQKHHTTNKM